MYAKSLLAALAVVAVALAGVGGLALAQDENDDDEPGYGQGMPRHAGSWYGPENGPWDDAWPRRDDGRRHEEVPHDIRYGSARMPASRGNG